MPQPIGRWISEKRSQAKMTQRKLAEILEIDSTYLSKIETGAIQYPIGQHVIEQLSELFEEDIDRVTLMARRLPQKLGDRIFEHQELFYRLCAMDESELGKVEKFVLGEKHGT